MVDKLINKLRSSGVLLKAREVSISGKLHGIEAELRLIEAVKNGDVSVVRKFLRFGLSPDIRDDYNRPLIFLACRVGIVNVVTELMDHNVDINVTTSDGLTALHVAVAKKRVDVVKLLLVSGASWNTKTLTGLKPIDIADYNSEIWQILKSVEEDGILPEMISYRVPELERKVEPKLPEPKKRKKKKKEKITEEVEEKTQQTLN